MSHTSLRFLSIFRTVERDKMNAIENIRGDVFAYNYEGVAIRVEDSGFSVWKSALGYSIFAEDNSKSYFDTLEEAKTWIDLNRRSA